MTDKRPELYQIQEPQIQEPEAPVKREIYCLSGIYSHRPADARPVGPPWPPQVDWREYLRRAKKIGV